MIEEYLEVLDLKDIRRTGWQIYRVEDPESVAAHSWSVATLVIVHIPEELDELEALKMALVHDIGESEIGDVPYRKGEGYNKEDNLEESEAVESISPSIDGQINELWQQYESKSTEEAKFVKDMDLIDMTLQALKYESESRYEGNPETDYDNLDEFFETTRDRLNTEKGKKLFKQIESRYQKLKST
jgi:putative hydrolase of HD superfamily